MKRAGGSGHWIPPSKSCGFGPSTPTDASAPRFWKRTSGTSASMPGSTPTAWTCRNPIWRRARRNGSLRATPAPQPAAQAVPPRQYSNVAAPPTPIPAQQTAPIQAVAPVPQAPAQRQQPPQKLGMAAPQQSGTSAPQQGATQPLQEPRNAEEAMKMPLEWAKNYRITVGIHTGKTLSEVAMIAPGALD